MKIGLLYDLRNPPHDKWFVPWPKFYDQALEHIAEADRLGFDEVAFMEHHGDPDGYNPSMMVIMTAVAMKTKNVVIGQNILEFPHHHPVRLAEDLATIDIISGGRVELDAGQAGAAFDSEFRMFGMNPKQRPSRVEEGLDIVQKCWTEDVFSYHGKRFELEDVRLYPKPLQKPHPPIFVTTGGEPSMDRAARRRFNACAGGGGGFAPIGIKEQWQGWRQRWYDALAKYGRHPGDFQTNSWGCAWPTDDPEREWAKQKDAIYYGRTYTRHDGLQPYARMMPPTQKPEDMPGWQGYFQTPDEMVARLQDVYADGAPDTLMFVPHRPGFSWEDCMRYMETLAAKVVTRLREIPVKW